MLSTQVDSWPREHPQREWWGDFVREALGIQPAPLQDSAAQEADAPWKSGASNE